MRLRGPPSPWSLWSTRTLIRASSVETRQGLKKPKDVFSAWSDTEQCRRVRLCADSLGLCSMVSRVDR